jgi:hypothetical protein
MHDRYVDDLFATSTDVSIIDNTFSYLGKVFDSELTVHDGKILPYLGMIFDFSTDGSVSISMPAYIDSLLKMSNTTGASSSPAGTNLFNIDHSSPPLDSNQKEEFHSMVARLLYLSKRTRSDILLTVSFLTSRVNNPTREDASKLTRLLKYINSTHDLTLNLSQDPSNAVHAFIDASYGVHDDFKSHTGMVITLGSGAIDVRSTKQKINTKSSTEAELVGLSDMCGKVIWHREFLIGQGLSCPPARIYQDNQSTMALIRNGSSNSERTRHVSIRYFWLKDRVDNKEVEVIYCPTEDMIADLLTKPLVGAQFNILRDAMLSLKY